VGDYLLHALATGKARSGPQTRRRWLAAHVGILLHRLDARLRRDGESVRDRITMVGFFIVMSFICVSAIGLGGVYFAVGKEIAGIAAAAFVLSNIATSLLIFFRVLSPRVWQLRNLLFFSFLFFFFLFRF
jgi:urease accessory protein UreH